MSDAYQDGVRLLSRRSLTRREVVSRLKARGYGDDEVDEAVSRLTARSAIDDRALAIQWIASRAAGLGRGKDRAVAELVARGVDESIAAAAWSESMDDGAIDDDALVSRAVRRRLGAPPGRADKGRLARVYNALLHEGFRDAQIETALAPYGFTRNDP
jgi:SOS response regulatory protein OraA/RecX